MTKFENRDGPSGNVHDESVGDKHLFAARVLTYGKVDSHGTSWAPGVFADSLRENKPTAVWSHQWDRPIGRVSDYRDSADGLDVIVELADFDAVPDARMAHSLLKGGVIDSFSFGFSREAEEPDPDNRGATRITKAYMAEISPVLVASGKGTRTLGVRSAPRAEGAELLSRVASGELTAEEALTQLAELRAAAHTACTCEGCPGAETRSVDDKPEIEPVDLGPDTEKADELRSFDELMEYR